MNELKLFVVGERSGDPVDWGELGHRTLVFAHDKDEAVSLTEFGGNAVEVCPSESGILFVEANHGNED